jgi:hypothetical protein
MSEILDLAEQEGITKIKFYGSGRYLEARQDGWYLTSDSESCDVVHGLKPEGNFFAKRSNET